MRAFAKKEEPGTPVGDTRRGLGLLCANQWNRDFKYDMFIHLKKSIYMCFFFFQTRVIQMTGTWKMFAGQPIATNRSFGEEKVVP